MALKVWNGMTGAGRKQPLREARKESWTCTRGHTNPRYATRCLTLGCNQERDVVHASDCALHNGPALPVGDCNCGASA